MSDINTVREVLGRESYRKLALAKAGTRIVIHATESAGGELAAIVGADKARLLSDAIGGTVVHINQGEFLRERNNLINAMRLAGFTNYDIAHELGICDRWVRSVNQGLSEATASDNALLLSRYIKEFFEGTERQLWLDL